MKNVALDELVTIIAEQSYRKKIIIALEGRSGSGKTWFADSLEETLNASLVRMDDFFLPTKLRTEERLSEPGGNFHVERFSEEVIPNLRSNKVFTYRKFNCVFMDYTSDIRVYPSNLILVDGVYSTHPKLGKYYDFSVFFDVDSEEQIFRIRKRNGQDMLRKFQEEWIPMEEKYIEAFDIMEKADYVIKI